MSFRSAIFVCALAVMAFLASDQVSARTDVNIDGDWHFTGGSIDGSTIDIVVDLPHTWNAMDVASEIARERGCPVFVSGSVYLVGRIIEEHSSRDGADLWDSLVAHPPRDETEG